MIYVCIFSVCLLDNYFKGRKFRGRNFAISRVFRSFVRLYTREFFYPEAESVHSALVSAVSKVKMSDLTESLAFKSIQKALPTE